MTRGELARRANVNRETIRYYEKCGLLPEPARRPSGYRSYGPEALTRLSFIRRSQELGFSLAEVRELLSLRADPETTCAEVKARAEEKIEEVGAKIRDLRRVKRALSRVAEQCTGEGPASECPILEALEGEMGDEG